MVPKIKPPLELEVAECKEKSPEVWILVLTRLLSGYTTP